MNLITKTFGWLFGNATGQRSGSQPISPASAAHEDTPSIGIDSALQVSTVWACVTLLVETIASLPLIVYTANGDERVIDKESRLYKILHDSPNKRQTSQEFWEQMILN